jgi:hypothetical protein
VAREAGNGRGSGLELRGRIALVALSVFVPFVVALAVFSVVYFARWYEEAIGTEQLVLAARSADELDHRIAFATETLARIAGRVPPPLLADPRAAQRFLDQRITLHVLFDDGLTIVTADGAIVAESPDVPGERPRDLSAEPLFRSVAGTGKAALSRPYLSRRGTSRPCVSIAAPIRDDAGRIVGQLHGSASLHGENLVGDLASTEIGQGGYFVLIDRQRLRLAHPDPARQLRTVARGENVAVERAVDEGLEGVIRSRNAVGVPVLPAG